MKRASSVKSVGAVRPVEATTHGFAFSGFFFALSSTVSFELVKQDAGDFAIIEWMLFTLNVLIVLVSLAGNEHQITLPRILQRGLDGLTAVHNDGVLLRAGEAGLGVVQNLLRIFRARIV